MENERLKLGDIIDTLKGYAFKSQWYLEQGVPIVKVSNFTEDSIDANSLDFVNEDIANEYKRYSLIEDDIIIQTVGSWPTNPKSVVGKVIRVPENLIGALLNQNAVKIIPKNSVIKRFLFYALKNNCFKDYIINCAQGAANQASITLEAIRAYQLDLPSVDHQQKIASILSAYDDLIENNTRRIKILEEMAQTIYKEWFLNFRFPGHEKVKSVDSPLGKIPEGWEVVEVRDIVKRLKAGNVYTEKKVLNEGEVIVIDQSKDEYLGFHNNEPDHKANPESPIIIFGDHTCKMQILVEPFSVGPNVVPFKTNGKTTTQFLFYLVSELVETKEYKRHWNVLIVKKVVLPLLDIQKEFSRVVTSNLEMIDTLKIKNQNIRKTRDLLLPKLMSGEVEV